MFAKRSVPRRVEIEWVDSAQVHGWENDDSVLASLDLSELKICKSIGFVLHESEKSITVAGTISECPDQSAGAITIPKCSITDMRDLLVAQEEKDGE